MDVKAKPPPQQHRMKITKYNRTPSYGKVGVKKYWWADCSCGMYNGFGNKRDAEAWVCPRAKAKEHAI